MSRIVLSALLLTLLLVSPAQAADPAAQRAELDEERVSTKGVSLFEVGEGIWKTCSACAARGFVKRSINRPDAHNLCPLCVGVGQDATVSYR